MPLLSPLRYPGSKRRLVPYIHDVLRLNELRPCLFVEPFAGGASVALQLACDGVVDLIGLADADPLIASFWQCVFFDTDWLVEAVDGAEVTLENWYAQRAAEPEGVRDRAFKCLFLNRTSFSGILARSAGPIGGIAQRSVYKIDCRFPKPTLVRRIRQASLLRDRVAFVWSCSWEDCLARLNADNARFSPDRTFLYLDPPFYFKAEKLYSNYFSIADHQALHAALMRLSNPWLLSYDPAEPIEQMYSRNGAKAQRVEQLYSAAGCSGISTAQELIVTNLTRLPERTQLWRGTARNRE